MSARHTIVDCLPSLCQKLSDLVEVSRFYNKNNIETRCSRGKSPQGFQYVGWRRSLPEVEAYYNLLKRVSLEIFRRKSFFKSVYICQSFDKTSTVLFLF